MSPIGYGFCADCDRTTTLTEHGACGLCGSNSVLSRGRFQGLRRSTSADEGLGSPRIGTLACPGGVPGGRGATGDLRDLPGATGCADYAAVGPVSGGSVGPLPVVPALPLVPALGGLAAGRVSGLSGGAAPRVVLGGAA